MSDATTEPTTGAIALTADEVALLDAALPLAPLGVVLPYGYVPEPGLDHGSLTVPDAAVAVVTAALAQVRAAAPARAIAALLDYASDKQNTELAQVWSFNVAAQGQPAHTVTTRLDDRGQFAMLKVQGWLQLNAQTAGAMMPYSNVDFSAATLTVAEADSLVEQAAALDVKSYALLNQVQAGVTASPPTITTTGQIDQVFAGLTAAS